MTVFDSPSVMSASPHAKSKSRYPPKCTRQIRGQRGVGVGVEIPGRDRASRFTVLDKRAGNGEVVGGGNREGRQGIGTLAAEPAIGAREDVGNRTGWALQHGNPLGDGLGVARIEPGSLREVVLLAEVGLARSRAVFRVIHPSWFDKE